ncbi:LETM1-related biofilm-associated protein [Myroides sp. LJL119]
MNPSASGWIKKYYNQHQKFQLFENDSKAEIVQRVREIGFSYGFLELKNFPQAFQDFKYTPVELSKICYLQLLEKVYLFSQQPDDKFLQTLIEFYQVLIPHKNNIFTSLFSPKDPYSKLEEIFSMRWKEHFFSQSKDNDLVLNIILLSIDILAFEKYLSQKTDPNAYSQTLGQVLEQIILSFKRKINPKEDNDNKLIGFLHTSITSNSTELPELYKSDFEKAFITDLIICNAWDNESKTVIFPDLTTGVFSVLDLKIEQVDQSKRLFTNLISKSNKDYHFYKTTNLFGNILHNSTSYVELLLTRNKTRLVKEIQNNSQLMKLLLDSTHRPLNAQEKKIVKNQTLEIFKTIPSLAIFLLPGGTLLLPIILRFIPSLLPSAFNENMQQDD